MLAQALRQGIQAVAGLGTHLPFACVLAVHGHNARILPGQAQTGTGELHGREIGQHLHRLNAQARCEVAGNAVAQRVARGQHHAGLARFTRGGNPAGHGAELARQVAALGVGGDVVVQQGQRAAAAHHHIGTAQQGQCGRAQAGSAIVQHADHSARLGVGHVDGKRVESASAIFWPSKSHTSTCRRNLPP